MPAPVVLALWPYNSKGAAGRGGVRAVPPYVVPVVAVFAPNMPTPPVLALVSYTPYAWPVVAVLTPYTAYRVGLADVPYVPKALPVVAALAPYTPYPAGPEVAPTTPKPVVAMPYTDIPLGLTVLP